MADVSQTECRAQVLLRELSRELQDYPPPVGFDRMRSDLDEALEVIDKLLDELDRTTPDEPWQDVEGNPVPAVRDWLLLTCFTKDHELYDSIMALRGRNGRKWRKANA